MVAGSALDMASGLGVMCFAFIGIELASTMADEVRNPERDIPRAIFITGGIAVVSYLLAADALLALVPTGELGAIQGVMQAVSGGKIVDVLAQKRSPLADEALRRYTRRSTDEMSTYLALKYFALSCDQEALGILNKHYFKYPTSSREWAAIVRSFGECKYKPATAHLVETVTAMFIDLGFASHLSLLAIYPDAGIEFSDPLKTREEWERYFASHRQK
jgi:hypothetical protein